MGESEKTAVENYGRKRNGMDLCGRFGCVAWTQTQLMTPGADSWRRLQLWRLRWDQIVATQANSDTDRGRAWHESGLEPKRESVTADTVKKWQHISLTSSEYNSTQQLAERGQAPKVAALEALGQAPSIGLRGDAIRDAIFSAVPGAVPGAAAWGHTPGNQSGRRHYSAGGCCACMWSRDTSRGKIHVPHWLWVSLEDWTPM